VWRCWFVLIRLGCGVKGTGSYGRWRGVRARSISEEMGVTLDTFAWQIRVRLGRRSAVSGIRAIESGGAGSMSLNPRRGCSLAVATWRSGEESEARGSMGHKVKIPFPQGPLTARDGVFLEWGSGEDPVEAILQCPVARQGQVTVARPPLAPSIGLRESACWASRWLRLKRQATGTMPTVPMVVHD
jgi:hypothetical protein